MTGWQLVGWAALVLLARGVLGGVFGFLLDDDYGVAFLITGIALALGTLFLALWQLATGGWAP